MLLCRFKTDQGKFFGLIDKNHITAIKGSYFDTAFSLTNLRFDTDKISLLAPCQPSKIVAVGLNYIDHAKELGLKLPKEPLIFIKPSTSVIGPDDAIVYPDDVGQLDFEAELAVVIKKAAKDVRADQVKDYILGYTCLNDVTARDLQKKDGQWTRAKSFDTFCPIGPCISTDPETGDRDITLRLNGKLRQSSNTKNMIFGPEHLVSYISRITTLLPGDIVATGTPGGIGPMVPGDDVEISIEGIGSLRNKVVKDDKR